VAYILKSPLRAAEFCSPGVPACDLIYRSRQFRSFTTAGWGAPLAVARNTSRKNRTGNKQQQPSWFRLQRVMRTAAAVDAVMTCWRRDGRLWHPKWQVAAQALYKKIHGKEDCEGSFQ